MEENRAQLTSILFPATGPAGTDAATVELAGTQPDCFPDLALDQVVDRVVGTDDYDLRPVFWTPLATLEQVEFRHAVLADLAHERVQQSGRAFAEGMRELRAQHVGLQDQRPHLAIDGAQPDRHPLLPPERGQGLVQASFQHGDLAGRLQHADAQVAVREGRAQAARRLLHHAPRLDHAVQVHQHARAALERARQRPRPAGLARMADGLRPH